MTRQWVWSVALLGACAGASAQPSAVRSASIEEILNRIGSDSFQERTAATEELANATNIDANMLVEQLRSGDLSPETSIRVLEVVRRRFETSPRGAIGILFADTAGDQFPRVREAYTEFPACRANIVRAGDEFLEVDGESLVGLPTRAATAKVTAAVFSRSPGESVRMKIRRPPVAPPIDENGQMTPPAIDANGSVVGEILVVEIPLGSRTQLKQREDQLFGGQINQVGQRPIVVVEPNGGGKGVRAEVAQIPPQAILNQASRPLDETVLANAWAAYVRRTGIPTVEAPLSAGPAASVSWDDPGASAALGRVGFRPGGRILAGPVKAAAGTIAGLRNGPDVERNQEVLRDLAGGNVLGQQQIVVQRIGGADVIQLGDGVNRVEIQVVGRNVVGERRVMQAIQGGRPGGRALNPAVVDARLDGAREALAAELARVEAELRRLTREREGSPDDLSTTRLVEERVAELRAEWESLRAQAEAVASGAELHGVADPPLD